MPPSFSGKLVEPVSACCLKRSAHSAVAFDGEMTADPPHPIRQCTAIMLRCSEWDHSSLAMFSFLSTKDGLFAWQSHLSVVKRAGPMSHFSYEETCTSGQEKIEAIIYPHQNFKATDGGETGVCLPCSHRGHVTKTSKHGREDGSQAIHIVSVL